jgi:hypothetical protein
MPSEWPAKPEHEVNVGGLGTYYLPGPGRVQYECQEKERREKIVVALWRIHRATAWPFFTEAFVYFTNCSAIRKMDLSGSQ